MKDVPHGACTCRDAATSHIVDLVAMLSDLFDHSYIHYIVCELLEASYDPTDTQAFRPAARAAGSGQWATDDSNLHQIKPFKLLEAEGEGGTADSDMNSFCIMSGWIRVFAIP